MSEALNFKCPCCKAPLKFSGSSGEMSCEFCGSSFTMEQVKAAEEAEKEDAASSEMTWSSGEQALITDENGKVKGYKCPSCGAEMVADENTAATECPYCGNPAIIQQSFEGIYRPDLMVPFAIDKSAAKEKLLEFTKGKKLLPKSFTDKNRIEEITGIYVPFWLYSCHAKGAVSFDAEKKKSWDEGNYHYEKTDFYHLVRRGEMDFEKIPVDASTQMDDATMDSLEPYDLTAAVPYDAAYFSGYLADRYDVSEKDAQPRANERINNTFEDEMRKQVKDYTYVKTKNESVRLSDAKAEYAMLPVWMMTTKYEGKSYTFGINGQTGRMVGSLPVDKTRYFIFLGLGTLISMVVINLLVLLFGSNGMSVRAELISLVISLIVGLIYVSALKGSMKNIAKKSRAVQYMKEGSLKPGQGADRFLYSKTEKKEKAQKQ